MPTQLGCFIFPLVDRLILSVFCRGFSEFFRKNITMIKMRKKMNVLHIATLNRPIRQDLGYGPIETVIYNIDKGLHKLGHRSIVACSGDSHVAGEQYTTIKKSFREYWSKDTSVQRENMRRHLVRSLQRAKKGDIDIIHMHDAVMVEYIFKGVFKSPVPIVMTLHVPAEDKGSFKQWNESLLSSSTAYFVPISEYQRKQHHGLVNAQKVIHHGIDVEDYPFKSNPGKQGYLFSIGRITSDKGQDKAIEIAKKTGFRLILAGNVQNKVKDRAFFKRLKKTIDLVADAGKPLAGSDYYKKVMKPILDSDKQIIYIGEVDSAQKKQWYRYALATLFPIQWGEPFGLVLIESMGCGTPVVAFRKGSVPEIVIHGKTGFVADSIEDMAEAVRAVHLIDRSNCRKHVKDNFSIASMAGKYSRLYQRIIDERTLCLKTSP
ncbi:MAG: glycosyltransferase family 4 protein [Candidatus Omnitrophica bacterium]|nr:glycosyltransferase family 4 protein [Candidatus Omnitrophota bacterium]MBU4478208.1 glycosyltransferase family 4 protein [Candidatus Omnitrophota bacterium]